ncbi:MAG: phosphatase PAP2 family protein [Candidatus Limnocylindrales bacterium]
MTDRSGAATDMDTAIGDAVPPIEPPVTPDERGVRELAIGFAAALVAMLGFAFLADQIRGQEALVLDTVANPFLHGISSPTLDAIMNAITALGSDPVLGILVVLALGFLVVRHRRAEALFLVVAIAGSVALNGALKLLVGRPRPVLPWAHVLPDPSFPSGHSMNSVVFYLALAVIAWTSLGRRAGTIAVAAAMAIAFAIGFSRIYLGYHYLSDVIGGFTAGVAWLIVVALAFETIPRTWARRPWATRRGRRSR